MNTKGMLLAMTSFCIWGLFPLYWVNTVSVPAFEVLAHRGVWCVPVVLGIVLLRRQLPALRDALRWDNLRWLLVSSVLIAVNWGVYVWAVAAEAVTEAALGYYMTPLLAVFFGVLFFKERLSIFKWGAIGLAGVGVLAVAILGGQWPWFGLAVGFSFALYSSARKKVRVESLVGLTVEALVLLPIFAGYLLVLGDAKWVVSEPTAPWLLLGGLVTAVPLLTHVAASRRIPLSLLGMLFFTTPTLQVVCGVLVLGEPFGLGRAIAFGFIWSAVALFLYDEYRSFRRARDTARLNSQSAATARPE